MGLVTTARRALAPAFLAAITPVAAAAQEIAPAPEGVAEVTAVPAMAEEESPAPLKWTMTASTGISARDDSPDGTWQSVALQRQIGRAYARASLMRYHGTLIQADTALPSDYYVATLGGGANIDNWVFDGWVSYGVQDYGRISTDSGSRASTGARSSAYYAAGVDFGRILTLGPGWYLTPTVTAGFAHGKLLRPAPTGSGLTDLETTEPTFTASGTVRLDHAFGASHQNYMGVLFSRNWSSNGVSELVLGSPTDAWPPTQLDSAHHADGWFEAGATANLKLTDRLYLDTYATRSFGVAAGNVTSAGISLRRAF